MLNKYYIELKKTKKQIKDKLIKYLVNPISYIYNKYYYNILFKTNHPTNDNEPFFKFLNKNYDDNNDDVFSDSDSPFSNNDINDDTISNEDEDVDISFDN
jgi:hypothetical protein